MLSKKRTLELGKYLILHYEIRSFCVINNLLIYISEFFVSLTLRAKATKIKKKSLSINFCIISIIHSGAINYIIIDMIE